MSLLAVALAVGQPKVEAGGPVKTPPATQSDELVNTFSFPGEASIQDEAHCGIINGKLTCGIPFKGVARVEGLWAPPYHSGDFRLNVAVCGKEVPTQHYTWWPFKVERSGEVEGLHISTATVLAAGQRAGVLAVTIENATSETRQVPLRCDVRGSVGRSDSWEFQAPSGRGATKPDLDHGALIFRQNTLAIIIRAEPNTMTWDAAASSGRVTLTVNPGERASLWLAFAMGSEVEAAAACQAIASDPAAAIRQAHDEHARRVRGLFEKLPRMESSDHMLARWYLRSLVHFLTNRWDLPESALHPYYGTGSVNGGCICCYLWNYGETWEIMPLYDAAAHREHIKQFLRNDMSAHFAFDPISGKAFGPWYPVNQEKLVGLVYYYVKNTGNLAFLGEKAGDKTVLEHVIAQACCRDDLSKPAELIDYGPSNSHLELRRGFPYNHKMPDLNGRRYASYLMAARLAGLAGRPAPELVRRAADVKKLLKEQLWNDRQQWLNFIGPKGRDTRWTNQMFKLFGSGVLDDQMEKGLLSHLNEREFLSQYGLHSLAKHDIAYDPADIDNGGPGSCTSFPPQIAERLYKSGHADVAEDLVRRTRWWGDCLPYWGDSIVADKKEYRKDTPLQCTVDGVAIAQCVIFGMFGIEASFDGDLLIRPHPPKLSPRLALRGVKLRGSAFDVVVEEEQFEVRSGGKVVRAPVGKAVLLRDGKLSPLEAPPPREF
ncbi:MAG: hypothetical protein NTU53_20580 [Planctomycetota bacterium]|nr:hypothetical protein [Planctomycetota bacterium]